MSDDDADRLERVRTLVLGRHLEEADARRRAFEENLRAEFSQKTDELRGRFESLERWAKKEIESVVERSRQESEKRERAMTDWRQAAGDTFAAIDERLTDIEAKIRESAATGRSDLLREAKAIRDDVASGDVRQRERLDAVARELDANKLDRGAMANLFAELAESLAGGADPDAPRKS